ncbi:MAG TPA: helix-turn-helix transcriptional regulator [Candidatus Angelobacter sp.]|nr:helix-turn-helix transcriptional regulator [Candidatus Angelobacter sp.]
MNNEIQQQLGAKIRELRTKKGLSQEDFAFECKLHRSHLGEIERGEANVTLSTLLTIAHALGTSIASLFKGIPGT